MAVTIANLTSGNGSGTSGTTASIAPAANKLVIVIVQNNKGSTPTPTTPTISGNSITWSQVATVQMGADRRLTMFKGLAASPSAGAITIDFAGNSQDDIFWIVDQVTNAVKDISTVVVQSATVFDSDDASPATVTLAAFSNAANATYGAFSNNQVDTYSPGSGFSAILTNTRMFSEYKSTNDTSVDCTFLLSTKVLGIAIEIKAQLATGLFNFL